MTLDEFKATIENGPYAWPGGYPLYFVMADGEALSFAAAIAERARIEDELTDGNGWPDKEWIPVACEVNWEDDSLYCAHSNAKIESAYRED